MTGDVFIVLESGEVFAGKAFGAKTEAVGELVFTTGMGGYIETLTDPSYCGQIVLQTFPLIGNYGIISADFESRGCFAKGYVVRDLCETPSNFRSELTLDAYLKSQGIPGVYGVDTRVLTKLIREKGVMNAVITTNPDNVDFGSLKAYKVGNVLSYVSTKEHSVCLPVGEIKYNIALMDYGAKLNIVRELTKRGCRVEVFPCDTAAKELEDFDAVMLSNGPGDPADYIDQALEIKKLLGKKPIFGICLGHQLLALAAGAKTKRLKYGHRGVNHPVKDITGSRTFITTQNHGYAVDENTLPDFAKLRYVNANDGSCEGIDYPSMRAFSVQFHPEACAGPLDTEFLFDSFLAMVE